MDLTTPRNPRLTNRMPQTDAAAVALARDGDSEAFRALVERHSRAVYRLAHRMTGTPQDAEDVVQETFLKAYKQLSRFESRANFGTWLHRIAVNCSIDSDPRAAASRVGARRAGPGTVRRRREPRRRPGLAGAADVEHRSAGPRQQRDVVAQPDGTGGLRAAPFRRAIDRGDQPRRSGSRRTRRSTASSGRSRKCASRSSRS